MITPHQWVKKRPGLWIPVFFLSLVHASGQSPWQQMAIPLPGGSLAARSGELSVMQNQAGLGSVGENSLTIFHARPYLLGELGISSLAVQFRTGNGAFGSSLSTFGITGLRYWEGWISYGMKLYRGFTAGVGFHFWNTSIPERLLHQPGISFALGFLVSVNERLTIGTHVYHPLGWYAGHTAGRTDQMVLTSGFSFTFFRDITLYSSIRFHPAEWFTSSHGIELKLKENAGLFMGMYQLPFSISGGIWLIRTNWKICCAFAYSMNCGSKPSALIVYGW